MTAIPLAAKAATASTRDYLPEERLTELLCKRLHISMRLFGSSNNEDENRKKTD